MDTAVNSALAQRLPDTELQKGLIFDIQRYSIQDGPGIRTTVFFKGCPLTCLWCSNPESQSRAPQILRNEQLCTGCNRCEEECPHQAIRIIPDGPPVLDKDLCQACGQCVETCLPEARILSGKWMTVDEVVEVIEKDKRYYRDSGGGVTASGGEATTQASFLLELFKECREREIHTTLETCGFANWKNLEPLVPYVNLLLYDIKHMDPVRHKELTGVSNELILENARRFARLNIPIIVRVPAIPGCNDEPENMKGIAKFASELGAEEIHLLPYHRFGSWKYDGLGREYPLSDREDLSKDQLSALVSQIKTYGVPVKLV